MALGCKQKCLKTIDLTKLNQYIITMSTNKNRKVNFKILIPIVLLAVISIIVYVLLRSDPVQTQEERINKVKQDLVSLIPGKYEIEEGEYEEPSEENDYCINLFTIYPKEYSEIEREYLANASIEYCQNIDSARINSQTGEFIYDQEANQWLYIEGDSEIAQEEMTFGNNTIAYIQPVGSHYSWDTYISRLGDTSELIILYIPGSNRIRCERYDEDGVETMDEECVNFRDSLPPVYADWVPEEIYKSYYDDLLEMLKII